MIVSLFSLIFIDILKITLMFMQCSHHRWESRFIILISVEAKTLWKENAFSDKLVSSFFLFKFYIGCQQWYNINILHLRITFSFYQFTDQNATRFHCVSCFEWAVSKVTHQSARIGRTILIGLLIRDVTLSGFMEYGWSSTVQDKRLTETTIKRKMHLLHNFNSWR